LLAAILVLGLAPLVNAQVVYVSQQGSDDNPGTKEKPLASFQSVVFIEFRGAS
jgi:hypothetical protein